MSAPLGSPTTSSEDIPEYSKTVLSELIHHAVQNDKIEIFAQPIVRLPSRRINYLELFARIRARAGIYLPADTYRTLAAEESTIENVDHLLLLHTIDTIRSDARRGTQIGYFINICAQSLKTNALWPICWNLSAAQNELWQKIWFSNCNTQNTCLCRHNWFVLLMGSINWAANSQSTTDNTRYWCRQNGRKRN